MSNAVYGYFESEVLQDKRSFFTDIERAFNLGFIPASIEDMHNFPPDLIPGNSSNIYYFIIGDYPGYNTAEYLIDGLDYDPEADIGLPTKSIDRLKLLASFLKAIAEESKATKLIVAISDSGQIYNTQKMELSCFLEKVVADDQEDSAVYEIIF